MWSGGANLVDNQFRSFHLGLNVMESNCFTIFEMLPNSVEYMEERIRKALGY